MFSVIGAPVCLKKVFQKEEEDEVKDQLQGQQ